MIVIAALGVRYAPFGQLPKNSIFNYELLQSFFCISNHHLKADGHRPSYLLMRAMQKIWMFLLAEIFAWGRG
jgi:hypothetical protein